ncbi:MAG: DoxX family membrane protein [Solirubrobacterales bacterium]|nr:DoxX family membrane protein [Solirubrobacterales bacterium]
MSTEAAPARSAADPALLARGLAALRIFVGVIALSNGLAKLFSFRMIDIGPYSGTLVDRPEARGILEGEAARNDLPLVPSIVNDVVLPSYDVMQWLVTFTELGTGALLILGLLSRGAALIVFAQHFGLQLLYFSSGGFAFEQPHEWVPPLILALVPAGLVWGLDGRLGRNRDGLRWPS